MGSVSLVHWLIIALVVLLLFGAGRLSNVMGEFAKGIKAFRAGLRDDEPPAAQLQQPTATPMASAEPASTERKTS